jgi:hypothetical protein
LALQDERAAFRVQHDAVYVTPDRPLQFRPDVLNLARHVVMLRFFKHFQQGSSNGLWVAE